MSTSRSLIHGIIATALVAVTNAEAQISSPPRTSAQNINAVGVGVSYGEQNDRDAYFWGWSDPWIVAASISWDEETERVANGPDKVVKTYTAIGTISYSLSDDFAAPLLPEHCQFASNTRGAQSAGWKSFEFTCTDGLTEGWSIGVRLRRPAVAMVLPSAPG